MPQLDSINERSVNYIYCRTLSSSFLIILDSGQLSPSRRSRHSWRLIMNVMRWSFWPKRRLRSMTRWRLIARIRWMRLHRSILMINQTAPLYFFWHCTTYFLMLQAGSSCLSWAQNYSLQKTHYKHTFVHAIFISPLKWNNNYGFFDCEFKINR